MNIHVLSAEDFNTGFIVFKKWFMEIKDTACLKKCFLELVSNYN
jgi:hypothetical protein